MLVRPYVRHFILPHLLPILITDIPFNYWAKLFNLSARMPKLGNSFTTLLLQISNFSVLKVKIAFLLLYGKNCSFTFNTFETANKLIANVVYKLLAKFLTNG
jgi:hypothetical protein